MELKIRFHWAGGAGRASEPFDRPFDRLRVPSTSTLLGVEGLTATSKSSGLEVRTKRPFYLIPVQYEILR